MKKAEQVKKILDDIGIQSEIKEIKKDGKKHQALMIGSADLKPTIYPDEREESVEEIVEIVKIINESKKEQEIAIERITDWRIGRDHLQLCARPITFDEVVTMPYLDIELYVNIILAENYSTKVTKEIMENLGVTKRLLFETAMNQQIYTVKTVYEKLKELNESLPYMEECLPLWIVSNKDYYRGSGAICDKGLMQMFCDHFGDDFYVIPCSIHELLVSPVNVTVEEIKSIVKEINATEVSDEDFLSNNVYIYRKEEGKLTIA